MPCVLLLYADVLRQLAGRDAFLMRRAKPNGDEPFLKRDLGVFEDRSHGDAELLTARRALVAFARFDPVHFLRRSAMWAHGVDVAFIVSPTDVFKVLPARLIIRKLSNEIDQGVVSFGRKHDLG